MIFCQTYFLFNFVVSPLKILSEFKNVNFNYFKRKSKTAKYLVSEEKCFQIFELFSRKL